MDDVTPPAKLRKKARVAAKPIDSGVAPIEPPKRKRRQRRTTEEVLKRIIAAAIEEFELNGYAGATTAAIARKAAVAEALIFSNFGSKSKLFHASIFTPLNEHLTKFCSTHLAEPTAPGVAREEASRQYIAEVRDFIDQHQRKLISLFFMQTYGDSPHGLDDIEGIHDYLNLATEIERANPKPDRKIQPQIMARLSFASIFSSVVFYDWLFPDGVADKDEVFASLIDFVSDGLNANWRA